VLQRHRHQEVPALGAVALFAVDEALRAGEPTCRRPHLTPKREVDAEVERAPRCPQRLAAVEARLMSTFEHVEEVVHAAEHVEGRRQQLEIHGSERRLPVGLRQRSLRV